MELVRISLVIGLFSGATVLTTTGCNAGAPGDLSGISTGGSGTGATGSLDGTGGTGTGPDLVPVGPGTYALPPPNQCNNQFYAKDCVKNDATSACGGICEPANVCANEGKPGATGFACPRDMLFSDEMVQATKDDSVRYTWPSESPFAYAVVGHDTDMSADSVDDPATNPCCQCYQLVFDLPEDQVLDQTTRLSTVTPPKPLVVQAFNTGATTKTFDIYMGAGGLGAFNGCAPGGSALGSQYTAYPMAGQPSGGGIKAVGEFGNNTACKNTNNLVTSETIESEGCQTTVANACNQITANSPAITAMTRRSCIDSNKLDTLYHQNWKVLAKRVACPESLTEVTGCKLVENTLPAVDPNVTTAAQAKADSSFKSGYSTTTMQDCCKPTCAWQDKVTGNEGHHVADGLYNSFYTCDAAGVPVTE